MGGKNATSSGHHASCRCVITAAAAAIHNGNMLALSRPLFLSHNIYPTVIGMWHAERDKRRFGFSVGFRTLIQYVSEPIKFSTPEL
jgi:hypothetical protein